VPGNGNSRIRRFGTAADRTDPGELARQAAAESLSLFVGESNQPSQSILKPLTGGWLS